MFNILTNVRGRIVGGLTALLMGGMSVFSFAQAGGHESVLRVIPHADLKNLDPIWTTAYISRNHGYLIYDTLFAMDSDFNVQPQMVDTYTKSDDGMNWSFTLRDGLTWHNGDPVTAADCDAALPPTEVVNSVTVIALALVEVICTVLAEPAARAFPG